MPKKLNLEKEYREIVKLIDRKFMLERCKLYKVQHGKNADDLKTLCLKYLRKLDKMQPWDIPDDENGNAGWVNPDRILQDDAIKLVLARLIDHPSQNILEENVRERIRGYIKQIEEIELVDKYKMKKSKK